ncbi:glucose-6-phosphate dehydrogenase [Streptomyces sp. NPDC048182]|uniref:glucose-6-phosphate dehydrogenase n=1 Tax=Streptomyces sp. NPDC048182 TaxID=3365507 RepID=UPI00371209D2
MPLLLVLFGATGDLAKRMLFPALFELYSRGLLPEEFVVVGSGRHSPGSDADFRRDVAEAVLTAAGGADRDAVRGFAEHVTFATASAEDGSALTEAVAGHRSRLGEGCRTLVYLSVPPEHLGGMLRMVGREGIADGAALMVEKPLGEDVGSARELNALLASLVPEDRILRVDHFLAKEPVRDLLTLRTANGWLASQWDAGHIAWVRIDVSETIGIEGRASFMESTGTFKDMVPTHLGQVLAVVAAEPPAGPGADAARAARLRLFEQTRPFDPAETVFGQYEGYRDEDGVAADSGTETFAALRVWVDNDRWRGVPFLLRTGKALGSSDARVTLRLRAPAGDGTEADGSDLVVGLGEPGDLRLGVRLGRPGPEPGVVERALRPAPPAGGDTPGLSAYARVFRHALEGDRTVFTSAAEVERLWELAAPILERPPRARPYPRGSSGPEDAERLAPDGGRREEA